MGVTQEVQASFANSYENQQQRKLEDSKAAFATLKSGLVLELTPQFEVASF